MKWATNHPLATIILLGIVLRLIVAYLYGHITIYPDSGGYTELAERLSQLHLGGYQGQRTPGYPLLISIAGGSLFFTVLLQSLLGIATSVVGYKMMRSANISPRLAWISTLLIGCYLPILFFELAILSESLTLFFITSCFYIFFEIAVQGKRKHTNYFLLTLICSYLVFIKPFYIFLPLLLVLCLWYSDRSSIKQALARYLLLLLIPASVFVGWSYVNKINTGYFVPTTFYGFNAAQNCVSFAENTSPQYKEIGTIYASYRDKNRVVDRGEAMSVWEAYNALEKETQLSFVDLSNELYNYAKVTIAMNKAAYLKQVAVSWRDFWKTSFYWQEEECAIKQAEYPLLYTAYVQRVVLQLIKIAFLLLIPYNILLFFRNKKLSPSLVLSLIIFTASVLQAFASYGTNSRFSFPFEVLIIVSVVWNVYGRLEHIKQKS